MRSNSIIVAALILAAFAFCSHGQAPPLVDGDCGEYPALKATTLEISKDVPLSIYQDRYYVWLCYSYPDRSFATADLKLVTPGFPSGMNLHVSAQLGEWPLDKPDLAPKNAESELWWNHKGWTANTVWINGMDRTSERPRYKFKNASAREIQIGKARFGRGRWKFSIEVRSVMGSDGKTYDVIFPAVGQHSLRVS